MFYTCYPFAHAILCQKLKQEPTIFDAMPYKLHSLHKLFLRTLMDKLFKRNQLILMLEAKSPDPWQKEFMKWFRGIINAGLASLARYFSTVLEVKADGDNNKLFT